MRIGLFDVDSHNFPNLPLMKLSAWHKSRGDTVEWWDPDDGRYSIVYASKVFTESVLPAMRGMTPKRTFSPSFQRWPQAAFSRPGKSASMF